MTPYDDRDNVEYVPSVGSSGAAYVAYVRPPTEDEGLWLLTTGKPGFIVWSVLEVAGESLPSRVPLFKCIDIGGLTDVPELAEPVAEGRVKWDGCNDFFVGLNQHMAHTCEPDDTAGLGLALVAAHRLAMKQMGS
jgi:hypothetical protein